MCGGGGDYGGVCVSVVWCVCVEGGLCVCVCVSVCVRAFVRACVRACDGAVCTCRYFGSGIRRRGSFRQSVSFGQNIKFTLT